MATEGTFDAPAHWATYLIYGDDSGLSDVEREQADSYLESELPGGARVVSCGDESRFTWSYRFYGGGASGGDVLEYTYLAP